MIDLQAKLEAIKAKRLQPKTEDRYTSWLKGYAKPSRVQYEQQRQLWERFKNDLPGQHIIADIDTLLLFTYWCANNSNGRLGSETGLADVKTISRNLGRFRMYYNACHEHQISRDNLEEARRYLWHEVAGELGLESLSFDKEFADWEDLKMMMRYLMIDDPHIFRDNRVRVQLMFVFLLIADSGERIGAIVSSTSYPGDEVALCYKDIKLFRRPSSKFDCGWDLKMEITYHNRKGDRDKKGKYITQIYYQRTDLTHCNIFWFLILAFMDNAFDGIESPAQFFDTEFSGLAQKQLRFKQDKLDIPVCRRMKSSGSKVLSENLPWTADSVTHEAQRIAHGVRFLGRFTFYAVRRGVNNMLDYNNVSAASRKQLMGHDGDGDRVFREAYQSKKIIVDAGNMFRKEEPRREKMDELSMRISMRDLDIPEMPDPFLHRTWDNDEELRSTFKSRQNLRAQVNQLPKNPEYGYERVSINAALECLRRAFERRKFYLRKQAQKSWDQLYEKDSERLLKEYPMVCGQKKAFRSGLANVLYPEMDSPTSICSAIEVLIAYAKSHDEESARTRKTYHIIEIPDSCPPETDASHIIEIPDSCPSETDASKKQIEEGGPKQCLIKKRNPRKVSFTSQNLEQLIHLKQDGAYTWNEIAAKFLGRSKGSLIYHYNKWLESKEPSIPKSRDSNKIYTSEEDRRLMRLRQDGMSWVEIEKRCSGRTLDALRTRYWRLLAQDLDRSAQEFTPEEDEHLMLLRDQEGYSWVEIERRFQGRNRDLLRMQYNRLRSRYEWVMKNGFVLAKIPIAQHVNSGKRAHSEVASSEDSYSEPKRRRTDHAREGLGECYSINGDDDDDTHMENMGNGDGDVHCVIEDDDDSAPARMG